MDVKEYLEGGAVRALLVFHNEGMADTDVEPEVCSVEAQHCVIHFCSYSHQLLMCAVRMA